MENDNWKLVGYGLNIRLEGSGSHYERAKTYNPIEMEMAIEDYEKLINILGKDNDIDLEKIYCNDDNGDYDYEVLRTSEKWWEIIEDNRIDFIDDSGNDRDVAVFLKIGYLSPTTNCGYFHSTNRKDMQKQLDNLIHISKADEYQLRDYFEWVLDSAQPDKLLKEVKELFKGENR